MGLCHCVWPPRLSHGQLSMYDPWFVTVTELYVTPVFVTVTAESVCDPGLSKWWLGLYVTPSLTQWQPSLCGTCGLSQWQQSVCVYDPLGCHSNKAPVLGWQSDRVVRCCTIYSSANPLCSTTGIIPQYWGEKIHFMRSTSRGKDTSYCVRPVGANASFQPWI